MTEKYCPTCAASLSRPKPPPADKSWIVTENVGSDPMMSPWVWRAAQFFAVWSGAGFALEFSGVAPGAINMGIGVGVVAVFLIGLACLAQWIETS